MKTDRRVRCRDTDVTLICFRIHVYKFLSIIRKKIYICNRRKCNESKHYPNNAGQQFNYYTNARAKIRVRDTKKSEVKRLLQILFLRLVKTQKISHRHASSNWPAEETGNRMRTNYKTPKMNMMMRRPCPACSAHIPKSSPGLGGKKWYICEVSKL